MTNVINAPDAIWLNYGDDLGDEIDHNECADIGWTEWTAATDCAVRYVRDDLPFADDWPGADREQKAELQAEVEKVVAAWLTKHGLHPNFWQVVNVKKVQCRITSETGEYEIVEASPAPSDQPPQAGEQENV